MFIFCFGSLTLLCLWYLNLSNPVRYITFNTNLSIHRKKNIGNEFSKCILSQLSLLLSGLLCSECSPDVLLTFIIHQKPSLGFIFNISQKFIANHSCFFITSHIVDSSYPQLLACYALW